MASVAVVLVSLAAAHVSPAGQSATARFPAADGKDEARRAPAPGLVPGEDEYSRKASENRSGTGSGARAGPEAEAESETHTEEPVLWASVAPTLDEAEADAALLAAGRVGILLLSDALVSDRGEDGSSPGPIRNRLARLARRTRLVVGAPVVEQAEGGPGDRRLALILVAPDGSVLAHSYAAMPAMPIAGAALSHSALRQPARTVTIDGVVVGIAAVGDGDAAIPLLSERGARLVLLTGGPVSVVQAERFAEAARLGRVALLIAGRCAGSSSCVASAAVDARGKVDWSAARKYGFARDAPRWSSPGARGLPETVPHPAHYDPSPALAELGRAIFFDRSISDSGSVSCASCHDPSRGFSDGRPVSVGAAGRSTTRNSISLLNVAFRPALRWDAYPSSLENFIKYPLSGHSEMASHQLDNVVGRIARSRAYVAQFAAVFGTNQVELRMVEQALATYMRTLVSGNSPFDQATVGGRRQAMTESAWRGYALFGGRAGCVGCHSYSEDSPFFTDFQAHNTGLGWDAATFRHRDAGAGAIAAHTLSGSFRTPTLRDVARTGPYMHDGSIPTLRGVIDYFDAGGGRGPKRDSRLKPLHLSEQDKQDLEAFLIALTGTTRYDAAGRRTDRHHAGGR